MTIISISEIIIIICVYLSASIPWAVMIGKIRLKDDIRNYGDKNPGTVNVFRAGSILWGFISAILEISKSRISKAHWYRAILNGEAYNIEDSIEAGYMDEVVEISNLTDRAMEVANDLASLGHPYYKITKELDQKETLDRVLSTID